MLRLEEERASDAIAVLVTELEDLAKSNSANWRIIERTASEPEFADFVDRTLSAAVQTTLESKRAVLAAMIVRRLEVVTESPEEIQLRRASEIVTYLSEKQLLLLAAILLVQRFPTDTPTARFATRDEAEAWLCSRYFTLARRLKNASWTDQDFEMLIAMGAVRLSREGLSISGAAAGAPGAPSINEWLNARGVPWHEGLEGDFTSKESHLAYTKRYPTINLLSHLAAGEGPRASDGFRLDDEVHFTPVGEYLATMIYERLTGLRLSRDLLYYYPTPEAEEPEAHK